MSSSNVVPIGDSSPQERLCLKCNKSFLPSEASGDPRYCRECGQDFTVLDEVKRRTIEDYNEFKDILNKHTQKFRQVTLQGEFWKFNTRAIHSLSQPELGAWIEYHRGMVVLLEQEACERKVKQVQAIINTPRVPGTVTRKVTETTVKKTTRVKTDPMAAALAALGNLDPSQIAALLAKHGSKG